MPQTAKKYRVFISVADPSGDAHCAGLISAAKQTGYDISFVGVGGQKMASVGCELLEMTVGRSTIAYRAITQVAHFYQLLRRIRAYLKKNPVDLAVVCDSPSFNIHVAKAAKRQGTRTLFYVAPQLWAWGGWRIHRLRKYCDKLCCILPFEEQWFSSRGIDTTFVGNPLIDNLFEDLDRCRKSYAAFESGNLKLALMPGSRTAEIGSLWPAMQQIALRLKYMYPGASFIAVAPDAIRQEALMKMQLADFDCRYSVDTVRNTAKGADFALVASGSATLEVASAGCPMVVMYQSSRILWHLAARWFVNPKYFCLVNLLADNELVPEFMPYFSSIDPIVDTITRLVDDKNKLSEMSSSLIDLVEPLRRKRAGNETAKVIAGMLH